MEFATVTGKYYLSGSCNNGAVYLKSKAFTMSADIFMRRCWCFLHQRLCFLTTYAFLFSSSLLPALHPHLFIPSSLYVPINKGGGRFPSCWEFHFQLLTLLPLLGRSTGKHAGQYPFRGKGLTSSCDSFHSIWRLCLDEFFLLEFYLDVSEGFLCFRGYKLHIIKYGDHLLLPNHEAMLSY